MNESRREAAGFLCRWGILLLAVGAAGATAGAGLLAATDLLRDVGVRIILPDQVLGARKTKVTLVAGYLLPHAPRTRCPVAMGGLSRQSGALAANGGWRQSLLSQPLLPGSHDLQVRGVPYGPIPFRFGRARVIVPRADQRLFFLDARWVRQALEGRPHLVGECVRRMGRLGVVAIWHAGEAEEFQATRKAMNDAGLHDVPVVGRFRHGGTDRRSLWSIVEAARPARPEVVTADPHVGRWVARRGVRVHAIGGDWPTARRAGDLLTHGSLAAFRDYLGAEVRRR